jgi:hypothetical protein
VLGVQRAASALSITASVFSLCASLFVGLIFYEVVLAPDVITYVNVPFPVVDNTVAPGEEVTLIVERCANDPLSRSPLIYTFTRELVDIKTDVRYPIADGASSMPLGCQTGANAVLGKLNIIPLTLPDGTYYLRGTTTARGLFKTNTREWTSQPFEVKRGAGRAGN